MGVDFLGLPFAPIEIGERQRLTDLLTRYPQPLSDYTFASLVVWSPVYHYYHARAEGGTLLVASVFGDERQPSLLQPIGPFPEVLQEKLLLCARELPNRLRIESVSEEFLQTHARFAAHFEVSAVRDGANYVYNAADLAWLRGRRYAGKRNLIAQSSRLHPWSVEPLDPIRADQCLGVADNIATRRTTDGAVTLEQEMQALERAISLFAELDLHGLLLRIEGRAAAFSIFDRLNPTTAVVMFERALRTEKGLYQVINRETARVIEDQGFSLINREEDLGDPGLRKAKLSYQPARLEMKYTLTLRA
jgi:hypothetical protein